MKKAFLTVLVLCTIRLQAQWVVEDPAVLAQTILNTYLAQDQLKTFESLRDQWGDPSVVRQVAGAAGLLRSLPAKAPTPPAEYGQSQCFVYDGNGLYRPIHGEFRGLGGAAIQRDSKRYGAFAALEGSAAACRTIQNETEARRASLLEAIRATTEQVQRAKTIAEVNKLQVIAAAQTAALSDVNAERLAGITQVLLQDIENRANEAKQQVAGTEERTHDFAEGSKKVSRFLTPSTTPVLMRSAKAIQD